MDGSVLMKLERKHKQLIVLGIGLLIMLFGLAQVVFKFEVDRKITDEVTFVLMIIAAFLLFSKPKNTEKDKITEADNGNAISEASEQPAEDVKEADDIEEADDIKETEESVNDDEQSRRND